MCLETSCQSIHFEIFMSRSVHLFLELLRLKPFVVVKVLIALFVLVLLPCIVVLFQLFANFECTVLWKNAGVIYGIFKRI